MDKRYWRAWYYLGSITATLGSGWLFSTWIGVHFLPWGIVGTWIGVHIALGMRSKRIRQVIGRLPRAVQLGVYAVQEQKRMEAEAKKELEAAKERAEWEKLHAGTRRFVDTVKAAEEERRKCKEAAEQQKREETRKAWEVVQKQFWSAPHDFYHSQKMPRLLITHEEWTELATLAKAWKAILGPCPIGSHQWVHLTIPPIENALLCSTCGAIGETPLYQDNYKGRLSAKEFGSALSALHLPDDPEVSTHPYKRLIGEKWI